MARARVVSLIATDMDRWRARAAYVRARAPRFLRLRARLGPVLLRGIGAYGASLIGIFLGLMIWQTGHWVYGKFILPSPLQTAYAVFAILTSADGLTRVALTLSRVATALAIALTFGAGTGMAAGYLPFLRRMLSPLATVLLGMPAIAWVVLTMIWFGPTTAAVVFTIVIVILPVLFLGAADAVARRDRALEEMAAAFGASRWQQFVRVTLRQTLSHLLPIIAISVALAFKVAIMGELLTYTPGIGGALARARSNLDVDEALGWIALAVLALLLVEHFAVRPLQRRLLNPSKAGQVS